MSEFLNWCREHGAIGAIDTTCTEKGCRWHRGRGRFCLNVDKVKVGNRDEDPESWALLYQCPNRRYTEELQVMTEDGFITLASISVTNDEIKDSVEDHHNAVNALRQQKIEEWYSDPKNVAEAEAKLANCKSILAFK